MTWNARKRVFYSSSQHSALSIQGGPVVGRWRESVGRWSLVVGKDQLSVLGIQQSAETSRWFLVFW